MTAATQTTRKRPSRTGRLSGGIKLLLAAIFAVAILLPLGRMFLEMDGESIRAVFGAETFGRTLFNSVSVALSATVIVVLLAYALAVATQRVDIKLKGLFALIFTLPMLIPSISEGMGLVILLGNNGLLTRLLGLSQGVYGFWGIVIGSVIYAFPVAYLMFSDILHYEDMTPYEAARVLGLSRWRQFTAITLPYLRRPLVSIIFSVFTLVITDYGVPLMVGGQFKTIPVVMYQEVIGQLKFGRGAVYGAILLIPAVATFLLDLLSRDHGNSVYVTRNEASRSTRGARAAAYVGCVLTSCFILLPFLAFILLAFAKQYPTNLTPTLDNIAAAFRLGADRYLVNSVVIALSVAVAGTAIAFITAYFTARMHSPASRFLHLASITTGAIPGVVLGLSYVLVFKGSPIYGTIALLIVVNAVHFLASPYLMMYNSLSKINENLESVGETLGVSRGRMVLDIFLPRCAGTLLEMFSYFFVNCMMTISAVSFLATYENKPVSLMINQFEAQSQMECAAVVSLAILLVNLLIKAVIWGVRRARRTPTGA